MKIAFCVAVRQQQQFPNTVLLIYTLCQTIYVVTKAFVK